MLRITRTKGGILEMLSEKVKVICEKGKKIFIEESREGERVRV